jgi:acetylornithine deacetylase
MDPRSAGTRPLETSAYIEQNAESLVALVKRLVDFRTPNPPGRNTTDAQRVIADYLRDLGAEVEMFDVFPGDPDVAAILRGADGDRYHSILLNGHIDVADAEPESAWISPPYQAHVRDGRIYGRGTADMKGAIAGFLFALQAIRSAGAKLRGDVVFESVIGEEMGEIGTVACNDRGYRADFAICGDISEMEMHGQGGVITGWIDIRSPEVFHDAVRSRMIHAGGGVFGASAIEKMAKIIAGLQDLERHWAVMKSFPGISPGTTTINPAAIEGGRHPAFVADSCSLWCTVHFLPDETYDGVVGEVEEHIRRVAAADPWLREHPPTYRWGGRSMLVDKGEIFPGFVCDYDFPGARVLEEVHHRVTGTPAVRGVSRSVTDGGWLAAAGIPTVLYGPGQITEAHAVNESVGVEELVRYVRTIAETIETWCNAPK